MEELVVPVVVLLLVLGTIAVAVVYALRKRRRDAQATTPEPAETEPAPARRPPKPPTSRERRPAPAPPPAPVRPLSAASRERYLAAWQGVQTRAADRPVLALSEADTIVARLLRERGLPEQEPRTVADRRLVEALSAPHRQVLDSYRAGHALEQANSSSRSDPEQVSQGMVHLRRAFLLLVEDDAAPYGDGPDGPPSTPTGQRPRTGMG